MAIEANLLATLTADLKSLELLFDYTKFHIGLYLTLASAYITVASVKVGDSLALRVEWRYVIAAIIAFMLAGLAGGVIASSITQCYGIPDDCVSAKSFLDKKIGPWGITPVWFKARYWTYIEHTSFWIGLGLALFSFHAGRIKATNAG